jgi:hypothetical protein
MHPSGLTLARWNWPFKTDAERAIVARWFRKQGLTGAEPALF